MALTDARSGRDNPRHAPFELGKVAQKRAALIAENSRVAAGLVRVRYLFLTTHTDEAIRSAFLWFRCLPAQKGPLFDLDRVPVGVEEALFEVRVLASGLGVVEPSHFQRLNFVCSFMIGGLKNKAKAV